MGQLGYYTHYQEPGFGLMQLGVRFYDSEVGRFTQRDPQRHGMNWYQYASSTPSSFVDPTGLRDDRSCLEKLKICRQMAADNFNRSWSKAIGAGGFGKNETICLVGCGVIYNLTGNKLAFKLCYTLCTGLSIACTWVEIESCDKVKASLLDGCESGYQDCLKYHPGE